MLRTSSDVPAPHAPAPYAARLKAVREEMARNGIAGYVVPHADENQSEYLSPSAERLKWLTGFSGSAGTAIVLMHEAAVFIDGRYTLQVTQEVDTSLFTPVPVAETPPSKWLTAHAKAGDRIGYTPWLLTTAEVRRFSEACKSVGAEFVPAPTNPIDVSWKDRPAAPLGAVSLQPREFAGEAAGDKIARLQAAIAEKKADAAAIVLADFIAWIFNIRGSDISHNPVPLSFAILPATGKPELFIDSRKLSNAARDALSDLAELREPRDFLHRLSDLGTGKARVLLDPQTTPAIVGSQVTDDGGTIVEGADPAVLPKARKNPTELAGSRAAHLRDGAAVVRFLAWLDRTAAGGGLDEMTAQDRLAAFRAETARRDGSELADLSFGSISGAGPNGAIVHYHATPASNRRLEPGSLYLIDSGGQYRDGTTDITRTVAIGSPTAEMRDRFTRVLKGHIAIATARFPAGTSGAQLDALARLALWQAGLDYDHGTGHGVGSYLAVHEGPARISKIGTVPLEPGMILSNEPGYYKTGAYGIRIENLVAVKAPEKIPGGEREVLSFETLTLAPIDLRLVDRALLTADESAWLNAYHARILPAVGRLLDDGERTWLQAATRAL